MLSGCVSKAPQLVLNIDWLQTAKGFDLGHIDMVAELDSMMAVLESPIQVPWQQ